MRYILFLVVVFFTSFSLDYIPSWVCHCTVTKPGEDWCCVVVIKAKNKEEAELKFQKYIARKAKQYNAIEDKNVHIISTLKDAIMIEP